MPNAPKLIVLSEQLRGKSFQLTKDLHTCGRTEDRDICLEDPTISSLHCELARSGNTYVLRDKGSTNGTRVNNVPITEQELQNSDILQVGGVEILYDCDDKSVTTVMRTSTGIDLSDSDSQLATAPKMNNVSPFNEKRDKGGVSSKIVVGVVVLLTIVILGLLAFLAYIIFGQKDSHDASIRPPQSITRIG